MTDMLITPITDEASGETRVQNTTKVTGKGQVYFVNRYCGVKA